MYSKLSFCVFLLSFFGLMPPVWSQELFDDEDPSTPLPFLRKLDYKERCNETFCALPCEGAAPPLECPANMPHCKTGCACHYDCNYRTVYCFMTKHCLEIRRFFTKPRRKPNYTV